MAKPKFDLGKALLAGVIGDFDVWRAGFDPDGELTDREAEEIWAKYSEVRDAQTFRTQKVSTATWHRIAEARRQNNCTRCGAKKGEHCRGDLTGIDVPWIHDSPN